MLQSQQGIALAVTLPRAGNLRWWWLYASVIWLTQDKTVAIDYREKWHQRLHTEICT